jgi:cell division protein ZapD
MKTTLITFEHPTNEIMRHLLKMESLFQHLDFRMNQDSPQDSKCALKLLLQLYQSIENIQLLPEILKEIERHIDILEKLHQTPTVNRLALVTITEELDDIKIRLERTPSLTAWLKNSYFLSQFQYRMQLPVGDLSFDLPALHLWLHQPAARRKVLLIEGLSELILYKQAVSLILHLTRESTIPTIETAGKGFFKKRFNSTLACQLIRVVLDGDRNLYPEILTHPNQLQIRFMHADLTGEAPSYSADELTFELTCCMI